MSSIPLGRRLVVLREAVKLGQKTVAGHLDIKASLLCDYEQGRKNPSPERVEEILRGLALPPRMLDTAGRFLAEVEAARRTLSLPAGDARQEAEDQAELLAWASAWAGSCVTSLVTEGVERVRVLADRQEARRLFGFLRGSTEVERRVLVARAKEYRNWALVVRLCSASEEAAADSAERAMDWARLALGTAVRVEKHDPTWMGKLRAFALVHMANAERVLWQLRKAETRWEEAEALWQVAGDVYPGRLDEAQWLSLKASLRIEQRRLTEALELVEKAESIDRSRLALSLGLKKGRIFEYMGAYDQAIDTLRGVGDLLGPDGELRLRLAQKQNLAVNICHVGRPVEAASLLPELRRLAADRGVALESLRVRWLEGRVAMGLGKTDEAREILESVRRSWIELGNAYEVALVSLELAAVYLDEGRTAEVKALAPQLVPVFRAEDGHGEAAKAVTLFCEAVWQEIATAQLARQVVAFLYRARHDPKLQFKVSGSEGGFEPKGRRPRKRRPVY
jgi:tetratricopeptide (TPR) repeat protein